MILKPRLALALSGACGLILALVILYQTPPEQSRYTPSCLFHQMTGLNCPGCGATRATYALLHLRIGEAFGKNLLFMSVLPFLVFWSVRGVWRWVRGAGPTAARTEIRVWTVWAFIGVVVAFGILRNLPWPPFNLLSPQ